MTGSFLTDFVKVIFEMSFKLAEAILWKFDRKNNNRKKKQSNNKMVIRWKRRINQPEIANI